MRDQFLRSRSNRNSSGLPCPSPRVTEHPCTLSVREVTRMAMAAIGISRIPLCQTLIPSTYPSLSPSSDRFSNDLSLCLKSSSNQGLCSSFHFSGEAFFSKAILGRRRTASGGRTPVLLSPKAVSDSRSSQTCLDPDASRVSWFCFMKSP